MVGVGCVGVGLGGFCVGVDGFWGVFGGVGWFCLLFVVVVGGLFFGGFGFGFLVCWLFGWFFGFCWVVVGMLFVGFVSLVLF